LGDAGYNCPENLDVEPGKRTEKQLRLTRASNSVSCYFHPLFTDLKKKTEINFRQ
jgi:hypothetical protein